MGYCFTRRGIGTFVSEDEAVFRTLKQERAEQLLGSFMEEMKALIIRQLQAGEGAEIRRGKAAVPPISTEAVVETT